MSNLSTLRACLDEINRLSSRWVSLDIPFARAMSSAECAEDRACAVLEVLGLSPEKHAECDESELRLHSGSPVLLCLRNGNWILFSCFKDDSGGEKAVVFDPTGGQVGKVLLVPSSDFLAQWCGMAVFMRSFGARGFAADGKGTAYHCMAAIAANAGVSLNFDELRYLHPLRGDEPSEYEIARIAAENRFRVKRVRVKPSDMDRLGAALPAMFRKKDGTYAVLCGCRIGAESLRTYLVWDPVERKTTAGNVRECSQEEFDEVFCGQLTLLRRRYSIASEDQPFSLRWFFPEFLRQKSYFLQIIAAVLALSVLAFVIPLFFQIVVDKVLVNASYTTLNVLGVGVVCALAFSAALEFLRDYLVVFATNKIDIRVASRAFGHLLKLPISFFEKIPAGVLIKHMQQLDKIRSFLSGSLFFSVLELLMLVVFLPLMWVYSAKLTLLVLLYSAVIASIIFVLIGPFQRRLRALYDAEGKRQSMLVESIHGMRTVKSLALEPVRHREWNDVSAWAITRYFSVSKISLTARSISRFIEQAMAVNIIWVGALDVFDHRMTIGALIAFQMLSGRVSGPIVKLIGLLHEYQQAALSVKMLGQVMNHPAEVVGGDIRPQLDGSMELDRVTFRYAPDAKPALDSVTAVLPAGSIMGIVGKSGSGKTTLTKLLQGLYPLNAGTIKFSGIDLREISRSYLRTRIGVVLQESFFFSGTIRENLLSVKPNATGDELIMAARLAGIEEYIQSLPRGFDTELEENAANMSGGQRQRLAIARALLPNPRMLILDEATSALDPESEEIVRRNLREIARGRTMIIVSHRLSMVTGADRILVLDEGRLVDSGTHRELVSRKGIYADFWVKQRGGVS